MKVSVVTVCFNSASTIEATLLSVKEQTWDNIEHIIIDGGSSDETVDIVNAHRDRVTCLVSEPDDGIYDAMNKGVGVANGEIVYFLNSDDRLCDPRVIEDVVSCFTHNPDARLVYGDVVYCSEDSRSACRFGHINKNNIIYEHLCHQAVFAHKELFSQVGLLNLEYPINADYDWLLRVFFSGAVTFHMSRDIALFDATGRHMDDVDLLRRERRDVRMKFVNPLHYFVGDVFYRMRRKWRRITGGLR